MGLDLKTGKTRTNPCKCCKPTAKNHRIHANTIKNQNSLQFSLLVTHSLSELWVYACILRHCQRTGSTHSFRHKGLPFRRNLEFFVLPKVSKEISNPSGKFQVHLAPSPVLQAGLGKMLSWSPSSLRRPQQIASDRFSVARSIDTKLNPRTTSNRNISNLILRWIMCIELFHDMKINWMRCYIWLVTLRKWKWHDEP